ncbi:MAG TPA: DsrE family protein [Chloroflexota bacterium]|nr:DsrE family protein [Chloroflexota bacterium]
MSKNILINCNHGQEDAERATLPFVVGNVAVTADQDAVVFLTIEGVRLATKGYADAIQKEGFQPLGDLIRSFVANGGQVWACGACTKPRGITEADLIEGARIVTAANIVEQVAGGATVLSV